MMVGAQSIALRVNRRLPITQSDALRSDPGVIKVGEETLPLGRSAAVSVPRPAAAHRKKSGALVYSGVRRLILRRSAPQNTAALQKCAATHFVLPQPSLTTPLRSGDQSLAIVHSAIPN